MFMANPLPGNPSLFSNPQVNNQQMGWPTNEKCVYGFPNMRFGKGAWNEALIPYTWVFRLQNTSLLPADLAKRVRYGGEAARSKNVLLTLQQSNYLLAEAGEELETVDDVYAAIRPLGINTTALTESRVPSPVVNIVVAGSAESTFNVWGSNYPGMAQAYFLIKRVKISQGAGLKYVLDTAGATVHRVSASERSKYVYQLVPWASTTNYEPEISGDVHGFFQAGRLVQATQLKDMASIDRFDNNNERLSRDYPEVLSKTNLVKMFVNII